MASVTFLFSVKWTGLLFSHSTNLKSFDVAVVLRGCKQPCPPCTLSSVGAFVVNVGFFCLNSDLSHNHNDELKPMHWVFVIISQALHPHLPNLYLQSQRRFWPLTLAISLKEADEWKTDGFYLKFLSIYVGAIPRTLHCLPYRLLLSICICTYLYMICVSACFGTSVHFLLII